MIAVLLAGVVAGFTYSLAGASLAIAYRASRTLNFALGGMGGFCAYVCLTLTGGTLPWAVDLIVAMLVGAVIGAATDDLIGRRLRRVSGLTAAMGLFGALLLFQGITELIWGSNDQVLRTPFGTSQISLGDGVTVSGIDLLSVIVAIVAVGILLVVLYRTDFGLQLRAASGGPVTAQTVGIRVRSMTMAGWAIGGALGAVAAVFVSSSSTMLPTTFSSFIFLALVAVTLGGMTSIWGVIAGGLVFGVALNVAEYELTTQLTYLFAYIFLAALLLYRPDGLLGRPENRVNEPTLLARPTQRALLRPGHGHRPIAFGGPGAVLDGSAADSSPAAGGRARTAVGVIVIAIVLLLLWYDGPILVSLSLTQVMSMFVAVVGLDILMGYCGQVSLAHGAFLGVGAYGSAIAIVHLHLPLALAFPVGIIVAAAVGVVVGLPAIRLDGLYFAQLTLLFALVVPEVITFFASATGGTNGLAVPQFTALTPFELFLLYGAIAAAVAIVVKLMLRSALGRHWRSVRDNPAAAAGLGQRVSMTKLGAFAIGCGLAGLGGVMQAVAVGSISPDSYPVWESIYLQAAQVVGGMTSLLGNLLGAFFVTVIPLYTGNSRIPPDLLFGAAFLLILFVSPRGIGQLVNDAWAELWHVGARVTARGHRKLTVRTASAVPAPDAPDPASAAIANKSGSAADAGIDAVTSPSAAEITPVTPVLQITGLRAGYGGGEVLHGIDLSVGAGEVVAVVGPNGAGKTTMLRAITGLILPSAGEVVLEGERITGSSPFRLARAGVAHVVEGRGIFPDLSVTDNLRLGTRCAYGRPAVIDDVADLFPALGDRRSQLGGTLSGGEQQMLALGRALLMGPRLLILDEPTLGLAPRMVDAVLAALQSLRGQLAVLIIEQNVRQVLEVCDRASVVADGRVVRQGTAEELAADTGLAQTYFGLDAEVL